MQAAPKFFPKVLRRSENEEEYLDPPSNHLESSRYLVDKDKLEEGPEAGSVELIQKGAINLIQCNRS